VKEGGENLREREGENKIDNKIVREKGKRKLIYG